MSPNQTRPRPPKPALPKSHQKVEGRDTSEARSQKAESSLYILRLYVAGQSPRSVNAISYIKKICEENLAGSYDLQIIDLYQQPQLADGEQIIAVPTLIKKLPLPLRRLIGDLSNTERVLVGLDLKKKS